MHMHKSAWTYLFWVVGFGKHLVFELALTCAFWRWNKSVRCFDSSYGPVRHWFGRGWHCDGSGHSSWAVSTTFHVLHGPLHSTSYRKPTFYFSAVLSRQWAQAVCRSIWTAHTPSVWWGCYSLNRRWVVWWFLIMIILSVLFRKILSHMDFPCWIKWSKWH